LVLNMLYSLYQPQINTLHHISLGLYPACIKYLMSAFDVPEVIRFSGNVTVCLS